MAWLDLDFNSVDMTITIPPTKQVEIASLIVKCTMLHFIRQVAQHLRVLCASQVLP